MIIFLKNINNTEPNKIIIKEYIEDFAIISSIAYSYVLTAKVSKLNGLSIRVIGSSFIISTKHKVRAFEETLTPEEKISHLTSIIKIKF